MSLFLQAHFFCIKLFNLQILLLGDNMKNVCVVLCAVLFALVIASCSKVNGENDIELMGAGDRIHDSYTFANTGVELEKTDDNIYLISGSVEKLEDEKVKQEFEIDSDITHVVAIKLSANGKEVDKEKVSIKIDGVRNYDAEHLNGSDYTFIILEAIKNKTVSITVSWNGEQENNYVINFDKDLVLK